MFSVEKDVVVVRNSDPHQQELTDRLNGKTNFQFEVLFANLVGWCNGPFAHSFNLCRPFIGLSSSPINS